MITLAALLAAALPALSQAQLQAPAVVRFDHPRAAARIWVLGSASAAQPDAVVYEGKDGLWLIEADELRGLSHTDGWTGWHYDVYGLTAQALTYKQNDALDETKTRRWDDDATPRELSNLTALLEFGGKKPAVLECMEQTYSLSQRRGRAETMRQGLVSAEKLSPDAVMDPGKLAGLEPELSQAQARLADSQSDCNAAAKGGDDQALLLYQAAKLRAQAERGVADAEQTLPTLTLPAY